MSKGNGIFNQRLSQIRYERRLTIKDLADAVNIPVPSMANYLKDREAPYEVLIKISNYFDVPVDYLIGKTDDYVVAKEIRIPSHINNDYMRGYSDGVNDLIKRINEGGKYEL